MLTETNLDKVDDYYEQFLDNICIDLKFDSTALKYKSIPEQYVNLTEEHGQNEYSYTPNRPRQILAVATNQSSQFVTI